MEKANNNQDNKEPKEHKEHKEFREQKEAGSPAATPGGASNPEVRVNWDMDKRALKEENERLKQENKNLQDKFLRAAADFDNSRKRWERDREEIVKFGTYKIVKDLIVFMDELERAIGLMNTPTGKENQHTFLEGVTMTRNKLSELLIQEGIKELDPLGKPFDPHYHEILAQEEKKEVNAPMVAEVFQKGYMFNDKLLRTAKVKVYVPASPKEPVPEKEKNEDKKNI